MAVYDSPSPTDIDPSTLARLRRVLQNCGPFNSDRALQSVFVDTRLSPWASYVPEAENASARVDALISYLLLRQNSQGENALLLFLQVLRDRTNPKDSCAGQLEDVINMLQSGPPDPTQSSAPLAKYAGESAVAGRRTAYQLLEERDSEQSLRQALDIFQTMGDQEGQVTSFYRLGDLAHRQGNLAEAQSYFEEALTIDGRHISSLGGRAAVLFEQGKLDEARQALAQAREIAPQEAGLQGIQTRLEQAEEEQRQRATLDNQITTLAARLSSETRLPQPFRDGIEGNLKQASDFIERGSFSEAGAALAAGEAIWQKWDEQSQEWLAAYELQRKLIEGIAALSGESDFGSRLSRAQQDLAQRAAEFDTATAWRRELERLDAARQNYEQTQQRLNTAFQKLSELPADQRAPFVQAEADLRQKLETMPLDDADAWSSLAGEIEQQQTSLAARIQELASVPPRERQYWLVVANTDFFDWRRAFAAAPDSPPIPWTEAKGDLNQNRLRQAGDGDLVLAYASARDERAIVGLGRIVGNPYPHEEGQAVRIAPERLLRTPITLEMLHAAVPETEKVRISQIGFAAVTLYEWSVIRELIRYHNPDLGPDDLPPAAALPVYRPTIHEVALEPTLLVNQEAPASVTVRNNGNVTWARETPIELTLDSSAVELKMRPAALPADIPPGKDTVLAPILHAVAPGVHDLTWIFTLHAGNESYASKPYQMSLTVQTSRKDDALFVEDESIPDGSAIPAGSRFVKQWRARNTGGATWNSQYQLIFVGGERMEGPDAVSLAQETPPGAETVLSVSLIAPAELGKRRSTWRLQNEQGQLFGDSFFADIEVVTPEPIDNAVFLEDVSTEDGTEVAPGETFFKAWRVRNSGNTIWNDRYQLVCVSDDRMGAPDDMSLEPVAPGAETVLSVPMIAPETPGKRRSTWQLRNEKGELFGDLLFAEIQVTVPPPSPGNGQTFSAGVGTAPTPSAEEAEESPPPATPKREAPPVAAPVIIGWQKLPDPPPDEGRIIVDVNDKTVTLILNDKTEFRSRNRLPHEELKNELLLTPTRYGQRLFAGIVNEDAAPNFENRSTKAGYVIARDRTQGKMRWQLRLDAESAAYPYKWEFLAEEGADKPLAVREFSPYYRLQGGRESIPPLPAHPVHVLFVIANPTNLAEGLPPINRLQPLLVDKELDVIRRAMAPLVEKGWMTYEVMHSAADERFSLDSIKERLQESSVAGAQNIHALHLVAHGIYLGDDFFVVLENEAREFELISALDFRNGVTVGNELRLIALATCVSAAPGQTPLPATEVDQQFQETGRVYRSLASNLVAAGIPAVIAMQKNMPIDAAQVFTQRFYGDLARSGRVDMAMAATRHDLYTAAPDSWTWGIPVLIMGQQDGKLFEVKRQEKDAFRPPLDQLDRRPLAQLGSASPVDAQSLVGALQSLLASRMDAPESPPELGPPTQDQPLLDRTLVRPVQMSGQALQTHVMANSGIALADEVYAQIASALNAGKHIILTGPPGTGKTSLAQDICAFAAAQQFTPLPGGVLATATADWTTFDTVGGYVPTTQQTLQFRLGIFLDAIRTGKWLIIDEINRAEIDKAFGELFTVLSGQAVTLPYRVGTQEIQVLPASAGPAWYAANARQYDYTIHPNWRIIGTMNVYDKSSLFAMSLAFMRRFAFIDLDLPAPGTYNWLVDKWLSKQQLALNAKTQASDPEPAWVDMSVLQRAFRVLLYRHKITPVLPLINDVNPLMERRALGPAIIKDMIEYLGDRYQQEAPTTAPAARDDLALRLLAEAFLLYVVPQLDALDYEGIMAIHDHLRDVQFSHAAVKTQQEQILKRIQLLYPHIRDWK